MSDAEFRAYVAEHYEHFRRFAQSQVGQHADDVVQNALLKLWRYRAKIRIETVGPLVFRSLQNEIITQWRGGRRPSLSGEHLDNVRETRPPEQPLQQQEGARVLRGLLQEARNRLTPRERVAVAVWLLLHPSRQEASELLQVTPTAYSGAAHHAVRKLNQALAADYGSLREALAELGHHLAYAVVTEVFQGDLPNRANES